jgi:hypothetical protein
LTTSSIPASSCDIKPEISKRNALQGFEANARTPKNRDKTELEAETWWAAQDVSFFIASVCLAAAAAATT